MAGLITLTAAGSALLAVTIWLGCGPYQNALLSELRDLAWILLAGPSYRRHARRILAAREPDDWHRNTRLKLKEEAVTFEVKTAHAALAEIVTAIKGQDAWEANLRQQLRINTAERARNFRSIVAIYENAEAAGLTAEQWQVLNGGLGADVARALTVASLDDM